jgi:hypothetical protein
MFCVKINFLAYFGLVRLILYVFRNIFCLSEVSTSSYQNGHLHGTSTMHPDRTWELQGSRLEVREEHLRLETSRSRQELIPRGQAHVPRILAFLN